MQKIMFNDKYGLTAAVLNGKKTMTRRIIKDVNLLQYLNELDDDGTLKSIKGTIITESNSRYKVGEIVAVAQRYKDIYPNADFEMIGNEFMTETAGWSNKMFVKADLMPHSIRITDIKVERLQAISVDDCLKEGVYMRIEQHPRQEFEPSEKKVIEYKVRASNSVIKQMILAHELDLCDRIIRKINEYYIHSKDIKINTIQDETGSKS